MERALLNSGRKSGFVMARCRKMFLFLSAVCLMASTSAFAQVMAGCDKDVWAAMNAKAQAQVAYDMAVTRELIKKPDSVLALTCFTQAAGVSAVKGGAIFSGNFFNGLKSVIPNLGNNNDGNFMCTAIDELWKEISTAGINTNVPYATFDDLVNGSVPSGAGSDYRAGWKSAADAGVFSNFQSAYNALDKKSPPPMDFSDIKSSCDVLLKLKLRTDKCPGT